MIFTKFINKFQNQLSETLKSKKFQGVVKFPSVYDFTHKGISAIILEPLTYELNLFREEGKLVGKDSKERFEYFENLIGENKFQNYFFQKYPLANDYIQRKIKNTVNYIEEIVNNYFKNKDKINSELGLDTQTIKDIKLGSGDTHNNGKTVAIVETDKGTLVYKPHSLNTDIIFTKLISIFNDTLKYKLHHIKTITYKSHGWQEFIKASIPSNSVQETNVYYKLGCYQGIFYILNSSDMHYENIILRDDNPYIIDTETLINGSRVKEEKFSENKNYLEDSVIAACLLPYSYGNEKIDVDFSGLFGGHIISEKIYNRIPVNVGLDTMKIQKILVDYNGNFSNKIQNDILQYKVEFINGFEDILNFVIENKNTILNLLQDEIFNKTKLRQLLRHTMVYSKYLNASYNPLYLNSYKKTNKLFNILKVENMPKDQNRFDDEIETMKHGDIPIFYTSFNNKVLENNIGIIDRNYFHITPKDSLIRKINILNSKQIEFQKQLIELCFSLKTNNFFTNQLLIKKNGNERDLNRLSNELFLNITDYVIYRPRLDLYEYIYTKLLPDRQIASGITDSLYESIGILLFIAFYEKRNNKDFFITSKLAENMFLRYEKIQEQYIKLSAFNGTGSLIYYFYNMYKVTNRKKFLKYYISTLSQLISSEKDKDTNLNIDFLDGILGIISLLCNIYEDNNDIGIFNFLNRLTINILNQKEVFYAIDTIGFAHGFSGAAYSLGLLGKIISNKELLKLSETLLEREDDLVSMNKLDNPSWCRGYGGMILARLKLREILTDYGTTNRINLYTSKLLDNFMNVKSLCLCHGIYGSIDVLIELYKEKELLSLENQIKISQYIENSYTFIDDTKNLDLGTNYNYQLTSFMLGSSGVGYELLRLMDNSLPSPLSLAIYKTEIKA